MAIVSIRRWQWIVISLVLGLLAGAARSWLSGSPQGVVGAFSSEREFEDALVEMRGPGEPALQGITVQRLSNGDYRIDATYYMRNRSMFQPGANGQPHTKPAARQFITAERYVPGYPVQVDAAQVESPGALQRLAEKAGLRRPDPPGTVVDYLRQMKAANKVQFQYLWWKDPWLEISFWTANSFVVVGLIWPTLVNLLAFGQLTRPREEKGIDLSRIRSSPRAGQVKSDTTQADLDQLRKLEAELEANLQGAAAAAPAGTAVALAAPLRKLDGDSDETAKPEPTPEKPKAFAAKPDDFYPTERHRGPKP